ncbi:MAG: hypothetical protein U0228_20245 [Myxococcaceae bacterium]
MTRALVAIGALLGLSACGPAEPAGPTFPIELYVTAGLNDQLSAFQISLVKSGSSLDCVAVQKACIKDQVDAARFVKLKDSAGHEGPSLTVPLSLTAGTPSSQDLTLKDLPTGKDFALVIEAVSKDTTPKLTGSSCNYIKELSAGSNPSVIARIELLNPAAACDPRH